MESPNSVAANASLVGIKTGAHRGLSLAKLFKCHSVRAVPALATTFFTPAWWLLTTSKVTFTITEKSCLWIASLACESPNTSAATYRKSMFGEY